VIIFQLLAVTYLLGLALIGGITAIAVIKVGGFQEYADRMNLFYDRPMVTSNNVQWLLVLMTLLWPLAAIALVRK
jgi:hypothetical protein